MDAQEYQEMKGILDALLMVFVEGRNYETINPYARPEVLKAVKYLAKRGGLTDWLDYKPGK